MYGSAADLDGHDRVEGADSSLKGRKVVVLVGEDTEVARLNTKTDASGGVLLRGLEPRIALRLLEDVVQDGVVRVVVHRYCFSAYLLSVAGSWGQVYAAHVGNTDTK